MYKIGIDLGYSAVKVTLLNKTNEIIYNKYILHKGKTKYILKELLEEINKKYGFENITYGAFSGSGSKIFIENCESEFVNEIQAAVEGCLLINKNVGSIVQIGGENSKYITNIGNNKSKIKFSMNSNCSAGTGSFLEEQISRLNLQLEDYSNCIRKAKSIPRIAGRCSVFSKTDITHCQQKGIPAEDILLGVSYSVVKNYKNIVMKKLPIELPLIFIGGTAHNAGIVKALKDSLDIDKDKIIISAYFDSIESIGSAVIAEKENYKIDLKNILDKLNKDEIKSFNDSNFYNSKLDIFGKNDSLEKHQCIDINKKEISEYYLGIDVGSTSTNLVIMNKNKEIAAYEYLKTFGDPIEAVRKGLSSINKKIGNNVKIIGVAVTGSGRYMISKLIGADLVKDEITAQAKAAITIDKDVDTIFEIGGQDSKYIQIENGVIKDFQMNKICAAGTGSFIEEQSIKFDIPINKFGDIALSGEKPVNLGERCTVFIEANIAAALAEGSEINNIASGLCYSIVKNYLDRVVAKRKIGEKIFFQGGTAYNQGIVNAFRAVTGKEVVVPPYFSITGAYGAAIIAQEEMKTKESLFKGFNIETKEEFVKRQSQEQTEKEIRNIAKIDELLLSEYKKEPEQDKKSIGIPYTLFLRGLLPMFGSFFRELGFNVILSDLTNEKTVEKSQEYSLGETCFPIKLIAGHIAELIEKKADYIFLPALHTMAHSYSKSRKNYGCMYLQAIPKIVNKNMNLKNTKLLSPTMTSFSENSMKQVFFELGKSLDKTDEEIKNALSIALVKKSEFEKEMKKNSIQVINNIKNDEKVFVIISKSYVVLDPLLNIGIPEKLKNMGHKVISFFDIPKIKIENEHPNMYWSAGKNMLEAAKFIKNHPNMYAILITNHSCGPDSINQHYFKEIMGDKPYLSIESDEHSSDVGVITRLEAFINSIDKRKTEKTEEINFYLKKMEEKNVNIKTNINELSENSVVYLPYLYPYSDILQKVFLKYGINIKTLPMTTKDTISTGKRFTTGEENYSLTAILGDCFAKINKIYEKDKAFLILQSEGAEVNGQYGRFLRAKLNEEGLDHVEVISPFIEDLIFEDENFIQDIFTAIIAGDIVNNACFESRIKYLNYIFSLIENKEFNIKRLQEISSEIYKELKNKKHHKKLVAVGDPYILFNDFMNDYTFQNMEKEKKRILYAPLSEYFWVLWKDFNLHNNNEKAVIDKKLNKLKSYIYLISECFKEESPFEKNLENIIETADKIIGFFSGSNGRYRQGKIFTDIDGIHGIITVASTYENTDIALKTINRDIDNKNPIISLNFDGSNNESNKLKLESFIYYL